MTLSNNFQSVLRSVMGLQAQGTEKYSLAGFLQGTVLQWQKAARWQEKQCRLEKGA
jgi:hypothetical protein